MRGDDWDNTRFCQEIRDKLLLARDRIDIDSPRYDNPSVLHQVQRDLEITLAALEGRYASTYPIASPAQSDAHQAYQDLIDQIEQGIASAHVTLRKSAIARNDVEHIRRQIARANSHLGVFQHVDIDSEGLSPNVDNDDFDFDLEKQEWYCDGPPPFQRIDEQQARTYIPQMDLVLMTVNPREFNAVTNRLTPLPGHERVLAAGIEEETYFLGLFGVFNAVVIRTRTGAQQPGSAGMAAYQAQGFWRPRALLALGVAFGADPKKQRIGDVLIATDIIPYHPARVGSRRIERGRPLPSDSTLLNRFENSYDWKFERPDGKRCRVKTGPILSGEELIDSPIRKAELLDAFPEAIGGEMEGSGIAAVAVYKRTPWILVKAICDWADGNKADKYQPLTAAAAADLAYHVFSDGAALGELAKPTRRRRKLRL